LYILYKTKLEFFCILRLIYTFNFSLHPINWTYFKDLKMNALIDDTSTEHSITSYGVGWIKLAGRVLKNPCIVTPSSISFDLLPSSVTALNIEHFKNVASLNPEIIIVGTGTKQIFLSDEIGSALASRNIGIEFMNTAAACRSFNVLIAEARSVVGVFYMLT
jgi:uncharacterized protein